MRRLPAAARRNRPAAGVAGTWVPRPPPPTRPGPWEAGMSGSPRLCSMWTHWGRFLRLARESVPCTTDVCPLRPARQSVRAGPLKKMMLFAATTAWRKKN
eukprot:scaffold4644_cov276-Prasinococcus_capsulatus_cf.AAC.1